MILIVTASVVSAILVARSKERANQAKWSYLTAKLSDVEQENRVLNTCLETLEEQRLKEKKRHESERNFNFKMMDLHKDERDTYKRLYEYQKRQNEK
jgi:hypothetical protein